jgi:choline dehydrogenase-like flavoprotein
MTPTQTVFTETQRRTLELLCDTFIPSVQAESLDEDERAFMARAAGDLQVPAHIEGLMGDVMTPDEAAQFAGLLDALEAEGFSGLDLDGRTALLHAVAQDPAAKLGLKAFRNLSFLFFYAAPDETGSNANWEHLGFPGPPPAPADPAPKTVALQEVSGETAELEADVVVVGSGAGGGVIAAQCAQAGKRVLVLEMGQYRSEADFHGLELPGYFELYYGGGLLGSESGSIATLAGSTLGGGTVVNYMNCVRTPDRILAEWEEQHGVTGLASGGFVEEHLEPVLERIGANTEATTQNAIHRRMMQGCDALGIEHRPIWRNASLDDDPERCGFCIVGCANGCKRSSMKTWLQDCSDHGGRAVVGCRADRVLTQDGRATGVAATVTHPDGSTTALTVHAPTVVVACGSIESPALLLRSGIGGPAVGKHLRLHPAFLVLGVYDEPIEGWRGQVQSALSDHFADLEDGCGFLVEATNVMPGLLSGALPWVDGARHKRLMSQLRWLAPFITVARDHGSGEVVLDDLGRALMRWDLDDEVDRRLAVRAHVELARLHEAAGAQAIITAHAQETRWQRGEDLDAFLAQLEQASYAPNDVACFTAHQMGSCRMGTDPQTSVADGRGELHDTQGVWIGDASAFPTAPGVNPMVTIMSLAHRTAAAIVAG